MKRVARTVEGYVGYWSIPEVRWNNGDGEVTDDFIFFGKGYNNYERLVLFIIHKRILAAVKGVEFVSDRLSHVVLGVRWCDDDVPNVPAPTEGKR